MAPSTRYGARKKAKAKEVKNTRDKGNSEVKEEETVGVASSVNSDKEPSGLEGLGAGEIIADDGDAIASDSEGPDDVQLVKGRDQAIEQRRKEAAAVKRVKMSAREKRRLKTDLFKKQKEMDGPHETSASAETKKLRKLAKFPEDDLSRVVSEMAEKKVVKKGDTREHRVRRRRRKPVPITETRVGSVKVVLPLDEEQQMLCTAPGYERAQEFLKEHFYGSRLNRVPFLTQLSGKKCRNRPALNFITKR